MKRASVTMAFVSAMCLAVLAACDSSEEEPTLVPSPVVSPSPAQVASPAPTATAAGETRAELEELLRSMALRPEDLPDGFTPLGERFITNEEEAEDYPEGAEQGLADYATLGRLLGYHRDYIRGISFTATPQAAEELEFCGVNIVLWKDPSGATGQSDNVRRNLLNPDLTTELGDCNPIALMPIGNAAFGYDCAEKLSDGTQIRHITGFMRRERAYAWVIMQGRSGEEWPSVQELEAALQKIDRRMQQALEPTAPPIATGTASGESALPHISDAECAYLGEFAEQMNAIGRASEETVNLLNEPAYSDADWRTQLSAQLDELYVAEERARQLRPPDSLADLNDDLRILASNWSSASTLLRPLLETQSVDSEAGQLIGESTQRLEAIGNKLSEFMATRSGTCD